MIKILAVIMAGGLGERLRPLTELLPKPLLPLGESSVLEIMLTKLKKSGFTIIYLATNYKSEVFEKKLGDGSKFGLKLIYSKENKKLGTAGPLSLLRESLKEPFLLMNGDIISELNFKELMDLHMKSDADITIVTKNMGLPCDYGIIKAEKNKVLAIEEKPRIEVEINAGIYIISPRSIELIPYNEMYYMNQLVNDALTNGYVVLKYLTHDYWLDVGQLKDYEKAQKDAKEGIL